MRTIDAEKVEAFLDAMRMEIIDKHGDYDNLDFVNKQKYDILNLLQDYIEEQPTVASDDTAVIKNFIHRLDDVDMDSDCVYLKFYRDAFSVPTNAIVNKDALRTYLEMNASKL